MAGPQGGGLNGCATEEKIRKELFFAASLIDKRKLKIARKGKLRKTVPKSRAAIIYLANNLQK